MQIDPVIERVFKKVYGKSCWRVSPGWGSFLTFEFGTPHLEIREPIVPKGNISEKVRRNLARRHVFIKGDWHLWINCCDWIVLSKRKVAGKSTSKSSIQNAADLLDGQKLTRFSINPKLNQCAFDFDLGGVLTTRPYDNHSVQWFFFDSPVQKVLKFRADGSYSYSRFDVPAGTEEWKAVQIP